MSVLAGTAPATTWYLSRSASAALFSGLSRFVRVPLGRAANASFVGANTVKGPLPESVDTAVATPDLSTLVTAVKAAGLVDTFSGNGPFTVFAPTNEAFAALPKGTLTNLLKPENKAALADLLKYHVVAGAVPAKTLMDMQMAQTVEGQKVTVRIAGGKTVLINSAKVVSADNKATNGIIHIIDEVLQTPAAPTPAPTPMPKDIVQLAESVK